MKSIFKTFLAGMFLLFPSLLLAVPHILITEIAPSEPNADWMELFVLEESDLTGLTVYEGSKVVKTFPPLNLKKYSYLILHFNSALPDENDTTGDTNQNGIWDLYLADTGLTATDNVISLRQTAESWLDAVCFSNRDSQMSKSARTAFNEIPAQHWNVGKVFADETNDLLTQSCLADWSFGKEGKSLTRNCDAQLLPIDSQNQQDWIVSSSPTPGWGYQKEDNRNRENPQPANFAQTEKNLEIQEPNPFSPHQGGKANIAWHLPAEANRSISIYDLSGRLVRRLLDQKQDGLSYGTIQWDGRNDNGDIVPIGVYIVYLQTKVGTAVTKTTAIIVVARKL
ncbi:MAG: FlgD immunoglobulin-like domain containing protein [Elusimicrobiota bacterium]